MKRNIEFGAHMNGIPIERNQTKREKGKTKSENVRTCMPLFTYSMISFYWWLPRGVCTNRLTPFWPVHGAPLSSSPLHGLSLRDVSSAVHAISWFSLVLRERLEELLERHERLLSEFLGCSNSEIPMSCTLYMGILKFSLNLFFFFLVRYEMQTWK